MWVMTIRLLLIIAVFKQNRAVLLPSIAVLKTHVSAVQICP